jgi:hypothetical protein
MGTENVPELIGGAQLVNIVIYRTSGFSFSGEWWADEDETVPIDITAISSLVTWQGETKLDVGSFATFTGNTFEVSVPSADTEALDPALDDECQWFFELESATQETNAFQGNVRIR